VSGSLFTFRRPGTLTWGWGLGGNREVSPLVLLSPRGDLSGAGAEAIPKEEGSWGKHGFSHGTERPAKLDAEDT
jgi:hypothetical protein